MRMRLFALLCSFASTAGASLIDVTYTGSFNSMRLAECQVLSSTGSCTSWISNNAVSSSFFDGRLLADSDSFNGSFKYDSSAPLTGISSDGHQAVHLNSVTESIFSAGEVFLPSSTLAATTSNSFSVVNDRYGQDSFYVSSWFSTGNWFASISMSLIDRDGSIYNDFTVPSAFDLADFEDTLLHLAFVERTSGDQLHAYGTFDTFAVAAEQDQTGSTAAPIPAPTTLFLFAAGLVAARLGGRKIRHRSNR